MGFEIIIGMAIAFVIGAFVRKPFLLPKKNELVPLETDTPDEERKKSEWEKMMSYTGEDDED